MSRDDGWRFMILGRSLERVDMTARMLEVQMNDVPGGSDWVSMLRRSSAYEAYLRLHRGVMIPCAVWSFFFSTARFTRSVYFSLAEAQRCVAEQTIHHFPTKLSNRARTDHRTDPSEPRLPEHPKTSSKTPPRTGSLRVPTMLFPEAGAAVASQFFQQGSILEWHSGGSSSARTQVDQL